MPPSAGACQTTLAELSPDCGRASNWSSTMTATTCRLAAAGVTSRPGSGAGTRLGVGSGGGLGAIVGEADGVASADGDVSTDADGRSWDGVSVAGGSADPSDDVAPESDASGDASATGDGVVPADAMNPPATTPAAR